MAVVPDTDIRLLKVPIELDNKNQLTFANATAQENYFLGLNDYIEYNSCQYQRRFSIMRIPAHIDSIIHYNYVMYKNNNYTDKWFYAFITHMEYENDGLTKVFIECDVFQTWQFDLVWKKSFIDREMINVANDLIGANRIAEGLETGEYTVKKSYSINDLDFYYIIAYVGDYIVVDSTQNISTPQRGYKYNGVYSSVCFIVANDTGFNYLMSLMPNEDNSNNILTIFTVPKLAITPPAGSTSWTNQGYYVVNDNAYETPKYLSNFFDALTTSTDYEGYVPKNKKLLQYPYTYLAFTPVNGESKIFRYEDFRNNKPDFDIYSEINPNPNVCFVPRNYRRPNTNQEYICTEELCSLSGYPNISYKTDVFNTWLAQNQEILGLNIRQEDLNYQQQSVSNVLGFANDLGNKAINMGRNIAGENPSTGQLISDTFNIIMNSMQSGSKQGFLDLNHENNIQLKLAQVEQQRMLPDKASLSSSATMLGYGLLNDNIFTNYTIRKEFAKKIDAFFDMYGYKTNDLKIPNLNNRPNWNYVKTIGANLVANIPQDDLQTIKNIFDNGVTLWHNPLTFLDYSQNNR